MMSSRISILILLYIPQMIIACEQDKRRVAIDGLKEKLITLIDGLDINPPAKLLIVERVEGIRSLSDDQMSNLEYAIAIINGGRVAVVEFRVAFRRIEQSVLPQSEWLRERELANQCADTVVYGVAVGKLPAIVVLEILEPLKRDGKAWKSSAEVTAEDCRQVFENCRRSARTVFAPSHWNWFDIVTYWLDTAGIPK